VRGFYRSRPDREGQPCFLQYEEEVPGTPSDPFLGLLRHEVTHQILFEMSKHDRDATRSVEWQAWCVEGIAYYLMNYVPDGTGGWVLPRPSRRRTEGLRLSACIAWCRLHRDEMPRLERIFAMERRAFQEAARGVYPGVQKTAATLSHFLLTGGNDAYRRAYLALLRDVHRMRDDPGTLDRCFAGIDRERLQEDFDRFVYRIELAP
jgi:hypothetical protein